MDRAADPVDCIPPSPRHRKLTNDDNEGTDINKEEWERLKAAPANKAIIQKQLACLVPTPPINGMDSTF